MYIHQGSDRSTNHLILLCDCYTATSGFETPSPSWVLSHELSHFVLSYKGYTHYAIQKVVHTMDERYNSCVATDNANCDEIKIRIHPDNSSKDYVVMKPYAPAIGNQLTKYLTDDLVNSKLISMQKQYTKLWVSGTIDDDTFITSIKNWIYSPSDLNSETDTPYMFIPNGFVIADISKSSPDNWHDPKKQYFMETKKMLLDNIPLIAQFEEEPQDDIPNWFKTRARLWSQDRISNDVFFNGIENLIRNDVISVK